MNTTEATPSEDEFALLHFALFLSAFYALLILFLYYLGNCLIDRERVMFLRSFDLG